MRKIVKVKPLKNYRVWIEFADKVEGVVDLSGMVGKGVFKAWEDINFFNSVYINTETNTISWNNCIDLCPDYLYAEVLKVDPLSILGNKVTVNF